ncbi:MAG TPA: hypothetical protein VI977_02900 [archaeon]|nr:hypothetical protein [archaeon]
MNEKGNLIIIIIVALLAITILPALVMMAFPLADIIMRLILVFLIFSTVRGYLGSNIFSLIISGILIYFLVIKYAYVTASLYILFYFLLVFNVFSIIIFGVGMGLRKG